MVKADTHPRVLGLCLRTSLKANAHDTRLAEAGCGLGAVSLYLSFALREEIHKLQTNQTDSSPVWAASTTIFITFF